LITLLFYAKSGFTYGECGLCGLPVLTTVSPWWLLLLPLNIANWPLFGPILALGVMAVVNAELIDRWSKRPQPLYPDWD
jgi:hypothetical protein